MEKDRRKILKNIGKTAIWTTPIVQSVTLPAHAQISPRCVSQTRFGHCELEASQEMVLSNGERFLFGIAYEFNHSNNISIGGGFLGIPSDGNYSLENIKVINFSSSILDCLNDTFQPPTAFDNDGNSYDLTLTYQQSEDLNGLYRIDFVAYITYTSKDGKEEKHYLESFGEELLCLPQN